MVVSGGEAGKPAFYQDHPVILTTLSLRTRSQALQQRTEVSLGTLGSLPLAFARLPAT